MRNQHLNKSHILGHTLGESTHRENNIPGVKIMIIIFLRYYKSSEFCCYPQSHNSINPPLINTIFFDFLIKYDTLLLIMLSVSLKSDFMGGKPVINNRVSYVSKNLHFLMFFRCFDVKFRE